MVSSKKRYSGAAGAADEAPPSRSRKKRESTALQKLGETLTGLPLARLADLPLGPELDEALRLMARITDHEGRRRQLQYIGRLMRESDAEAISAALERLREGPARDNAAFRHAERLRAALLAADGEETERLLARWPQAASDLRRLVARARGESAPQAARELFRRLRQLAAEERDPA